MSMHQKLMIAWIQINSTVMMVAFALSQTKENKQVGYIKNPYQRIIFLEKRLKTIFVSENILQFYKHTV
jgi:hypothetical protein